MSEYWMHRSLIDYLAVRRALGFGLVRAELLLEQFVEFCQAASAQTLTRELALAWVTAPPEASPSWLAQRLSVVRGFATWLQAADPATEIPQTGWLPPRRRFTPYLYSDDEITALQGVARRARWPLSAATYETLIGLLAVTGMRIGEAISLNRDDIVLSDGLLTIRKGKFGKSRQLLVHPSTAQQLRTYLAHRRRLSPDPEQAALFVHPAGNRITYPSTQAMFHTLTRRAGLSARSASCRPTIHGLRHTFAVNTLIDWYRQGLDVQARLPRLSTWLGHTDPKWTYWYLTASPDLLQLAAQRLQQHPAGGAS